MIRFKKVCDEIFSEISDYRGRYVIHFSSSKKLEILASAKKAGASVGCMHPVESFASTEQAIATMEKTVFGLTYSDHRAEKLLQHLVKKLKGSFIEVEDSKKPLYHAACCVASNYLVALFDYAADLALKIGIDNRQAVDALMGLAEGTLNNIGRMGTQKSLTGPIARGDKGTVSEHLENLRKHGCDEDIYRVMGKKAAGIALDNRWLEPETYKILISIMEDESRQ
ncbi:MAG: DUF2520 domain-containing protein [Actinomycetota bacterium]|nr:DUF2520 domain-containing protein [Actinomycetota bacterium]